MAAKTMKAAFMTGVHYLNHQQHTGESTGRMQMINRRLEFGKSLYSKDLKGHYYSVNAVEFSRDGEWLASAGVDGRVLIWNVDQALSGSYQCKVMNGDHGDDIYCVGFNSTHTKLYSGGRNDEVTLHDVETAEILKHFPHGLGREVYDLSIDPLNENLFVSACCDGVISKWDVREDNRAAHVVNKGSPGSQSVKHHPVESHYLATANKRDGALLWDVRNTRTDVMKYVGPNKSHYAMGVRFNSSGTHILVPRWRSPLMLYEVSSGFIAAHFLDDAYYNSCTRKRGCFAGEREQYVLSGSDDFNLYVWKIPDVLESNIIRKYHLVLRSHRSIPYLVEYNNAYGILASAGVEKIIKIWSSFPVSQNDGCVSELRVRKVFADHEMPSINPALEYHCMPRRPRSVEEDPELLEYFDAQIQRNSLIHNLIDIL